MLRFGCLIVALLAIGISATAAQTVAPGTCVLVGDFDGALGPDLIAKYRCQGVFTYVSAPTSADPANRALSIVLDASTPPPPGCDGVRGEVSEAVSLRLPLRTDIWYGFQFNLPPEMRGKIGHRHFIIAQLKQRKDEQCSSNLAMNILTEADGNPIVAVRLSEDLISGIVMTELSVSSQNVNKISVGSLSIKPEDFFGFWHTLLIHVYVDPRAEGDQDPNKRGFVEGFLDKEPFQDEPYGLENGKPEWDEPFGYPSEMGCDYFKFGIYGDKNAPVWTAYIDRFRRGPNRQDVEPPP